MQSLRWLPRVPAWRGTCTTAMAPSRCMRPLVTGCDSAAPLVVLPVSQRRHFHVGTAPRSDAIPTDPEKAARFWNKVAGVYDGAFFSFFCAEAGKHLVREAQLLDLATFRSGGGNVTVLDVGTGTGTVALGAARTLPDAVVYGTDLSQVMVEDLQRKAAESPRMYANVHASVCNATDLSAFESDTMDVVFSNMAMQFVDDQPAAFAEMVRVLRPGGLLLVSAWATLSMCPAIDLAYRALEAVQAAKASRVGREFVPFRHKPNSNFSLADRPQFADMLDAAGCTDVGVSMGKAEYTRASMSELTSMALQQFGPGIDDDELELFVETFQSLAVPVINEDRVFAMFNVGCGRKL